MKEQQQKTLGRNAVAFESPFIPRGSSIVLIPPRFDNQEGCEAIFVDHPKTWKKVDVEAAINNRFPDTSKDAKLPVWETVTLFNIDLPKIEKTAEDQLLFPPHDPHRRGRPRLPEHMRKRQVLTDEQYEKKKRQSRIYMRERYRKTHPDAEAHEDWRMKA